MNEIPDRKVLRLTRVCFYSVVSFLFVFRLFQTKNHKNPQWHCLLLHHAEIESCLAACVKMMICKIIKKKVERKESEYSKHTKQHTLTVTEWENQIYTIIKFVFCCWFEQHKKEKKTSSSKDTYIHIDEAHIRSNEIVGRAEKQWHALTPHCRFTTVWNIRPRRTNRRIEEHEFTDSRTHFSLSFSLSHSFSRNLLLYLCHSLSFFAHTKRSYDKKSTTHNTKYP